MTGVQTCALPIFGIVADLHAVAAGEKLREEVVAVVEALPEGDEAEAEDGRLEACTTSRLEAYPTGRLEACTTGRT